MGINTRMKLLAWRKAKGKTQMEVAGWLGVNQSQIARYEAGLMVPGSAVMEAIFEMTAGQVTANDFHNFRSLGTGGTPCPESAL